MTRKEFLKTLLTLPKKKEELVKWLKHNPWVRVMFYDRNLYWNEKTFFVRRDEEKEYELIQYYSGELPEYFYDDIKEELALLETE